MRFVLPDPAGAARKDPELVDVVVCAGAEIEDMHTVVVAPISAQSRLEGGRFGGRQFGQVIVHPTGAGDDVELVHMAVDADEVDVLAVVAAPITGEAGACFRLDRSHSIAFHRVVRLRSPLRSPPRTRVGLFCSGFS